MKKKTALMAALLLVTFTAMNCSLLSPGYVDALKEVKQDRPEPDVAEMLEKAKALRARAVDKEGVIALVNAYEDILKVAPRNYEALINASNNLQCLEEGYAMKQKNPEKKQNLERAIQYSIRAMAVNPEFKKKLLRGEPIGKACQVLTEEEFDGMLMYFNAVWYRDFEFIRPKNLPDVKDLDEMSRYLVRMELKNSRNIAYANYTRALYLLTLQFISKGYLEQAEPFARKGIETGDDLWYGYYMMKMIKAGQQDREEKIKYMKLVLKETLPEDDWWYPWVPPTHQAIRKQIAQEEGAAKEERK